MEVEELEEYCLNKADDPSLEDPSTILLIPDDSESSLEIARKLRMKVTTAFSMLRWSLR